MRATHRVYTRLSSSFVQGRKYFFSLPLERTRERRSRVLHEIFECFPCLSNRRLSFHLPAIVRYSLLDPYYCTVCPGTRCDTHYRPNDSAACFNIYYCIPRAPSNPCIVPRSNAIDPSICFDPSPKGAKRVASRYVETISRQKNEDRETRWKSKRKQMERKGRPSSVKGLNRGNENEIEARAVKQGVVTVLTSKRQENWPYSPRIESGVNWSEVLRLHVPFLHCARAFHWTVRNRLYVVIRE